MQYLFRFIQILSEFYLVSIGFNWFHMTSSDNCWVLAGNIWQLLGKMAGHLAARCWDFSERKEKWKKTQKSKKSKKIEKNELEKSKKSIFSIFSKLLLWEKLGDIRNTMPSRKPGQLTWQWVSMSAISAVRILPQMSEHDILRKIWLNIVKKCILVCIWFSKCGTLILWSECALLFPLKLKPSFSNRKVGVPTYPGKLVPGCLNWLLIAYDYCIMISLLGAPDHPQRVKNVTYINIHYYIFIPP